MRQLASLSSDLRRSPDRSQQTGRRGLCVVVNNCCCSTINVPKELSGLCSLAADQEALLNLGSLLARVLCSLEDDALRWLGLTCRIEQAKDLNNQPFFCVSPMLKRALIDTVTG